jgi:ribosomal protein S18 acetylase RimI-like enzyme
VNYQTDDDFFGHDARAWRGGENSSPILTRTWCATERPVLSRALGAELVSQKKGLRTTQVEGPSRAKASRFLWGIDWAEWLPRDLTDDGIELQESDIDSALPFIEAHYAEIFEQEAERGRFFHEPFDGAKRRYYKTADVFEIKQSGCTVGLLIGAPTDWSTYYVRTIGVLRAYQGRQLPRLILPFLFDRLAEAGVRRFEAETSPSNLASVLNLTRLRFNLTGTVLTERWGALLRFTKFVDSNAEGVFLDKFCAGIRYQKRRSPNPHVKP